MVDRDMYTAALENYRKAVVAYADMQIALMDAKAVLEDKRAHMLVAGVPGKNEAEREAHMRLSLGAEVQAVMQLERDLVLARARLNIAEMTLRVYANVMKAETGVD